MQPEQDMAIPAPDLENFSFETRRAVFRLFEPISDHALRIATISRSEACNQAAGFRGSRNRQTLGQADKYNVLVGDRLRELGYEVSDLWYDGHIDVLVARSLGVFSEPIAFFASTVEQVRTILQERLSDYERFLNSVFPPETSAELTASVGVGQRGEQATCDRVDEAGRSRTLTGSEAYSGQLSASVMTTCDTASAGSSRSPEVNAGTATNADGMDTFLAALDIEVDEAINPFRPPTSSVSQSLSEPDSESGPEDEAELSTEAAELVRALAEVESQHEETSDQLRFVDYLVRHHNYLQTLGWHRVLSLRSQGSRAA